MIKDRSHIAGCDRRRFRWFVLSERKREFLKRVMMLDRRRYLHRGIFLGPRTVLSQ